MTPAGAGFAQSASEPAAPPQPSLEGHSASGKVLLSRPQLARFLARKEQFSPLKARRNPQKRRFPRIPHLPPGGLAVLPPPREESRSRLSPDPQGSPTGGQIGLPPRRGLVPPTTWAVAHEQSSEPVISHLGQGEAGHGASLSRALREPRASSSTPPSPGCPGSGPRRLSPWRAGPPPSRVASARSSLSSEWTLSPKGLLP